MYGYRSSRYLTATFGFLKMVGGDSTYPVTIYGTVDGLPDGQTATWYIKGQANTIKFDNNQQQITSASPDQAITSIGWSSTESNLWLELEVNGGNVATSNTFTSRAPTGITESQSTNPDGIGWETDFTYTVKDKFNQLLNGAAVCEVFSNPDNWPHDEYPNMTWTTHPQYGNGALDANSVFVDSYAAHHSSPDVPTTVNPGSPGEFTGVKHNTQTYKVGGTGTAGYNANGFTVYKTLLQFCRGEAHY